MKLTDKSMSDILDMAKKSFRAGNYAEALEYFEYFFDHALDDDPSLYYGARLSYCLNGWQKLGNKYPQALRRLEQKGHESLIILEKTQSSRCFHDYISICKYLKKYDEPVRHFLNYHYSWPELAAKIVHYIWDELVHRKMWAVCDVYLHNAEEQYQSALDKFIHIIEICREEPCFKGHEVAEQVQNWYVYDVSNILLVLKNNDKYDAASAIQQRVESDMIAQGYPELIERVNQRVATALN